MEEFLTILKKLHDRCVTFMNKNQIHIGTSSIRWLSINFASALMIPISC